MSGRGGLTNQAWPCCLQLASSPSLFAKLGYGEVAIGPMWNHGLTRLEMERSAIELHRDRIGLERHQIGDATHLAIGVAIRPCRLTGVTNVVVAAEALVRAERLLVYRRQCGFIHVGTHDVPPRREA